MTPNYVYVIEAPAGLVKVGISRNPQARLGDLRGGMPLALRLVRTWPRPHGDAAKVERTAHRLLHDSRQGRTEWFQVPTAEAVKAVEKAAMAADARALKLLPREAIQMDNRERRIADKDALEWAKRNPGQLAKAIKAWSGQ